jgi:hypothetical protein
MAEEISCSLTNCRWPAHAAVLFVGHTQTKYYCKKHTFGAYGSQNKHVWTTRPDASHRKKVQFMEVLDF